MLWIRPQPGTGWGEAAGGQQGRAVRPGTGRAVSPGTGWGEAAGGQQGRAVSPGTGWGEAAGGQQGRAVRPGTGWGEAAGGQLGRAAVSLGWGEAAGGLRLGSVAKDPKLCVHRRSGAARVRVGVEQPLGRMPHTCSH